MQKTELAKYENELTQCQLDRFKTLSEAVSNGEITMNRSYNMACQSFDDGIGNVSEGFKGNFHDWINHAKSQGWIDKEGHLSENWNNVDANYVIPKEPIKQEIKTKPVSKDNKLMTLGVLALGAFILYKTLKK